MTEKCLWVFQDNIWKFHSDPYSFNIFSSFLQIYVLGLFIYGFIRYFQSDFFNGGRNFTCFLMPLVLCLSVCAYRFIYLKPFSLKWFFLFVLFFPQFFFIYIFLMLLQPNKTTLFISWRNSIFLILGSLASKYMNFL